MRFVLDRLDIHIHEIKKSVLKASLKGKDSTDRPTLIFICGENRNCFTADERLRVAATFVSCIDHFLSLSILIRFLIF